MALVATFDSLWPYYCSDVGLDEALDASADTLAVLPCTGDVEALLTHALNKHCAETGAPGTELAALMLGRLKATPEAGTTIAEAMATLQAPEVLEDISLDCPKALQLLADLATSLSLAGDSPRRLRVLAIRNGFNLSCSAAKALRQG